MLPCMKQLRIWLTEWAFNKFYSTRIVSPKTLGLEDAGVMVADDPLDIVGMRV